MRLFIIQNTDQCNAINQAIEKQTNLTRPVEGRDAGDIFPWDAGKQLSKRALVF